MKSTLDLSGLHKHKRRMKHLESKTVEWGFLSGNHSTAEMSYAQLAATLEYGTRSSQGNWHIPPRPAFRTMIDRMKVAQRAFVMEVDSYLRDYMESDNKSPDLLLNKTGKYLQELHQDTMRDWVSTGSQYRNNARETIDQKGFNMPFVYSGELINNVKYQIW